MDHQHIADYFLIFDLYLIFYSFSWLYLSHADLCLLSPFFLQNNLYKFVHWLLYNCYYLCSYLSFTIFYNLLLLPSSSISFEALSFLHLFLSCSRTTVHISFPRQLTFSQDLLLFLQEYPNKFLIVAKFEYACVFMPLIFVQLIKELHNLHELRL